ncbi:unnamed protein product [Closterium sp. Naga37s-1]|nr:unnamed protein product [Closterium sp. Naga37s-1]
MGSILEEHNVRLLGSPDSSASELVVLGHGFGTDQSVWQHIVPHLLDDDYRLLLLDLMGAGSTNPDNFSFARYSSLHGYADDLLAILEEVGAQQCTYVGHSVSGMIGCIAAIARPEAFKKIVLIGASPRYLNDVDYFGGFEQEDLNQLFAAMHSNFRAWVSGFAPLAVGADINCAAVQEFSRTFFCIRPDIALSVSKTIFQSDMRSILPQDLAVPVAVAEYMHAHLGGKSVVEIFPTHGHLPQLSAPHIVIPVLRRHLRGNLRHVAYGDVKKVEGEEGREGGGGEDREEKGGALAAPATALRTDIIIPVLRCAATCSSL